MDPSFGQCGRRIFRRRGLRMSRSDRNQCRHQSIENVVGPHTAVDDCGEIQPSLRRVGDGFDDPGSRCFADGGLVARASLVADDVDAPRAQCRSRMYIGAITRPPPTPYVKYPPTTVSTRDVSTRPSGSSMRPVRAGAGRVDRRAGRRRGRCRRTPATSHRTRGRSGRARRRPSHRRTRRTCTPSRMEHPNRQLPLSPRPTRVANRQAESGSPRQLCRRAVARGNSTRLLRVKEIPW